MDGALPPSQPQGAAAAPGLLAGAAGALSRGCVLLDVVEVGYRLRLDALGARLALADLCARAGARYEGVVGDSLFFMRAPSVEKQAAEKAGRALLGLLGRAQAPAGALRPLSPQLTDPGLSYHFWPDVLAVATEHTLEEAARVMQKKVKGLLSSETFIPCILATLARRAGEAGEAGDAAQAGQPAQAPQASQAGEPEAKGADAPASASAAPVVLVSEYPHLEPFYPGAGYLLAPSCRCLKQGAKSELERDMGTIYVTDTDKEVAKKVSKGFCEPRDVANNPVLDYFELVVLPLRQRLGASGPLSLESTEGQVEVSSMEELRALFARDCVQPQHLKRALTTELCAMLAALRAAPEYPQLQEVLALKPKK